MKNTEMLRALRMVLSLLLLLCLAFTAAVCGAETIAEEEDLAAAEVAAEAQAPDYLAIGREVTGILDEMLQSSDYQELFFGSQSFAEQIQALYEERNSETPVTVYRLVQGDVKAFFLSQLPAEDRASVESLSPALQEQLWVRVANITSAVCNYINSRKDARTLAIASSLTVLLKKPELEIGEPEYLLFVYEKGVPVLVTFGRGSVTGSMLLLDREDLESIESIRAILGTYGVDVLPFESAE